MFLSYLINIYPSKGCAGFCTCWTSIPIRWAF